MRDAIQWGDRPMKSKKKAWSRLRYDLKSLPLENNDTTQIPSSFRSWRGESSARIPSFGEANHLLVSLNRMVIKWVNQSEGVVGIR